MLVEVRQWNKQDVLTVSSREVAQDFEKEHKNILQNIEHLRGQMEPAENSAGYFIPAMYRDAKGEMRKEYLLTRDGFSLLVMGFTGEKALAWKLKYIRAFNAMEMMLKRIYEEKKQWEIERAKGVVIRHMLTDTIKMRMAEIAHKRFAYPNYTKLIYKTLFGQSFAELKQSYGIKERESLRDHLTVEQLREVEHLETLVSGLIGVGMSYEQIKAFLAQWYDPQKRIA